MDKEKDEKSYHKININWDDTANAKTSSKYWKNKDFFFYSYFVIWEKIQSKEKYTNIYGEFE